MNSPTAPKLPLNPFHSIHELLLMRNHDMAREARFECLGLTRPHFAHILRADSLPTTVSVSLVVRVSRAPYAVRISAVRLTACPTPQDEKRRMRQ